MSGPSKDERVGQVGQDDWNAAGDDGIKPLAAFDPDRIGPYRLLGRLGAGGMGRVFLARSESGRTVAVKVVHEEHVADEQFRARFRREIKAARKVGRRYTAPVLDADPDAEPPWVATGYVAGLSLEQVVRQFGPLGVEAVHTLADGLLRALKDIHGAKIVHRDLKPSNVMLTVDDTRIIDFGIARALETSVDPRLTSTGLVVGSPGFMAPEQVKGEQAGPRSDVFAVGCVLMYAVTGRLPFGQVASNQHALMFRIAHEDPDLADVEDPALRAFIGRCLIKDPGQRPDVEALLADPERVRPTATRGSWLPAEIVAHLAQRSARLLDADAVPLREGPMDQAVVWPLQRSGSPGVVPGGAGAGTDGLAPGTGGVVPGADGVVRREPERPEPHRTPHGTPPRTLDGTPDRTPRRRRTLIALPIALVLTVGGGAFALLQPWAEDDAKAGAKALPPGSSASVAPAGGISPNRADAAGSSSSDKDKGKGRDKDKKGGEKSAQGAVDESPGTSDDDKSSGDGNGTESKAGAAGSSGSSKSSKSSKSSRSSGSSGSGSGSGSSGSDGKGSSRSGGSSKGSPPPDMKAYNVLYAGFCFGRCSLPLRVSWFPVFQATRYDIRYTNTGSRSAKKNFTEVYSTGNHGYTITGPYSGDKVCVAVRAANKYGASAWTRPWCGVVPG